MLINTLVNTHCRITDEVCSLNFYILQTHSTEQLKGVDVSMCVSLTLKHIHGDKQTLFMFDAKSQMFTPGNQLKLLIFDFCLSLGGEATPAS